MSQREKSKRRPILLDAYAACSCPVKAHNDYDGTISTDVSALRGHSEALLEVFAGSVAYDQSILDAISNSSAYVVDLRPFASNSWKIRESMTAEAIAEGAQVILSPAIPIDVEGHRKGQPDLLVRGFDRDGRPGYLPVKCKRAIILQRRPSAFGPQLVSTLFRPTFAEAKPLSNASFRESRQPDQLQLAHFWRMLEAAGWQAGGDAMGGIAGKDQLSRILVPQDNWRPLPRRALTNEPTDDQGIAWFNLTSKIFRTFARTAEAGYRYRSALERYDHEHSFRVMVAEVASQRVGSPEDPAPRVKPIVIDECTHCQWWSICEPQLDSDDLSLRIEKSRLDVREISVLRTLGISTITDLADADLDELLPRYLPEVTHRSGAEGRIDLAARRARMLVAGIELERRSTHRLNCPRAGLEIDFDIETSAGDHVYLWGFLVHDRKYGLPPKYISFHRFENLDSATEQSLADDALTWLCNLLEDRPDALVYHYSNYEIVHIDKLITANSSPEARRLLTDHKDRFVDLFEIIRTEFFGAHGLGLKTVAQAVTSFTWRDDDPGGLNSQSWFATAVGGEDREVRADAMERVLVYNEDDTRATAAVREWLTSLDRHAFNDEDDEEHTSSNELP